jgi:preprotein translocase subunit SecY
MKARKLTGSAHAHNTLYSKTSDLRDRVLFTLALLVLFRLGTYIPLPSINSSVLFQLANSQAAGMLGIFNMFAGGALERMSIFSLNIMPYITASIIMQLVSTAFSELLALKKEGEAGRRKIAQYTKYLTIFLALFQGYGLAIGAEHASSELGHLVRDPGLIFRITAMVSLLGGTMFVMWLAEQITLFGIGNGSSLIIFTGIVSGLPTALATFFEMGKTGSISTLIMLFVSALVILLIGMIVFFEKAQRRILIQYPKRQIGNKIYKSDSTHLPLKLNTSGVIPPIFANAILSFPATIAAFSTSKDSVFNQFIASYLSRGKPFYFLLYILLIGFFSFFYSSIVFNSEETADSLRKNGGIVLGRRPGKDTAECFDHIISRITMLGIIYMSFICVMPEYLVSQYSIPFYLGGTSLMIVVNVVMDLFTQVQTHLLSAQYSGLLKKARMQVR